MRPLDSSVTARLHSRIKELGEISEEPGRLTRTCFSEALHRAHERLGDWGRRAALKLRVDAVDNLRMRWTPASSRQAWQGENERPLLVIGSHLDTVREAGRYDGALGVLVGLACIEQLQAWGEAPSFDLELAGFSDEEGLRFQTTYLGSSYYAGVFPAEWLRLRDEAGNELAQLLAHGGHVANEIVSGQAPPARLAGYLEVHIEQGPQLEAQGRAVGVVSGIAAQARARLRYSGSAGHAGTTPMRMRRDALCAAAEGILSIESTAGRVEGLRATVGQLALTPSASNVIPAEVILSVDLRHPHDEMLAQSIGELQTQTRELAGRRGVGLEWEILQNGKAVVMDPALTAHLRASAEARQGSTPTLFSGAGHDGAVLARVCPVAMLFVRCRGGLSHHPDEFAAGDDIEMSLAVLADTVCRISREWHGRGRP